MKLLILAILIFALGIAYLAFRVRKLKDKHYGERKRTRNRAILVREELLGEMAEICSGLPLGKGSSSTQQSAPKGKSKKPQNKELSHIIGAIDNLASESSDQGLTPAFEKELDIHKAFFKEYFVAIEKLEISLRVLR